jgi:Flp pilus assembly protein TadD
LARYPSYPDAVLSRGVALFEIPQLEAAESAFARARAIAPDDPRAPFNLGRVAEAMGDLDAARHHYEVSRTLANGGPAEAALHRLSRTR